MNRGASSQRIFFTKGDGVAFERLLGECTALFAAEVHAYCLMPNHYHLLLHCPHGGVSQYMQRLGSIYSRRINTRMGGDGPLFRSRFRSILVDTPEYLAQVGRYIHRNPRDLSPRVKLTDYRWSSFRHYAGLSTPPGWLHTSTLLSMCAGDYAEYVNDDAKHRPLFVGDLNAAIEMVVDEQLPDGTRDRRGLVRVISIALLDHCQGDVRMELQRRLELPSAAAMRMATKRARLKLTASPELERALYRVIDLLAA